MYDIAGHFFFGVANDKMVLFSVQKRKKIIRNNKFGKQGWILLKDSRHRVDITLGGDKRVSIIAAAIEVLCDILFLVPYKIFLFSCTC
jgi:hypothetical protein